MSPSALIAAFLIATLSAASAYSDNSEASLKDIEKATAHENNSRNGAAKNTLSKSNISNNIIWGKHGFKPLFIAEGPLKDSGLGDQLYVQVQKHLPRFNHVNTHANYLRIFMEVRKGNNVCSVLHLTEERAELMYFSDPVVITPSYQLYVSRDGKKSLDRVFGQEFERGQLQQILAHSAGLRIAITPKQSYGEDRDRIIAKHTEKMNVVQNFGHQNAVLKMLAANRADLALALPWVFNYEADALNLHGTISKIQLTDVPKYEVARIACAKTPSGRQVIDTIDQMAPAAHTLIKDAITKWLEPEELEDYWRAYNEYFLGSGGIY